MKVEKFKVLFYLKKKRIRQVWYGSHHGTHYRKPNDGAVQ